MQKTIDVLIDDVLTKNDVILDCIKILKPYFNSCQKCIGKMSTVNCEVIVDFMIGLMQNCKNIRQARQVSYVFEECIPTLCLVYMESLLREKIKMHARFLDNWGLNRSLFITMKRWKKKGLIRIDFNPFDTKG
ncbi:MAG: hypothetical protein ACOCWG_05945 [bacterium]